MLRSYTYQHYKADLDALIDEMSADEKEAQQANSKKHIDDITFLQDMKCLHKLSAEWIHLMKADDTLSLISAGRKLLKVYKDTRFSTHNYYPGVVGPRTLKLAQQYLELMQKAQSIIIPQVGNALTQPAINLAAALEKKEGRQCMKELEDLIKQYHDNTCQLHCTRR